MIASAVDNAVSALLVFAGAALTLVTGYALQRTERRATLRTTFYLDLIPSLEAEVRKLLSIAVQDPAQGPHWTLTSDVWHVPDAEFVDPMFRCGLLCGGKHARLAIELRRLALRFRDDVDPGEEGFVGLHGDLNAHLIGNPEVRLSGEVFLAEIRAAYQDLRPTSAHR